MFCLLFVSENFCLGFLKFKIYLGGCREDIVGFVNCRGIG